MSWDAVFESVCPIARSLSVLGDRWTMLIMRELSMGVHRFDEIQAQTKMSSHLLAARLKRLEQDGVIERRPYNERPPRFEYHATAKGRELDPILLAFRAWGMKWGGYLEEEEPAVTFRHKQTGEVMGRHGLASATGTSAERNGEKAFSFDAVEGTLSDAFQAEREANLEAFLEVRTAKHKR